MQESDIKQQINIQLKRREKSIRNNNAIDNFIKFVAKFDPTGGLEALYGVLTGSRAAFELERQKLTLDMILDMILGIDDKLSGKEIDDIDAGTKILIQNVIADESIVGIEGQTSNEAIRKIFDKPVNVTIKDARARNIAGIKLDVNEEMKLKAPINIETDFGKIGFDTTQPGTEITFGEGLKGE